MSTFRETGRSICHWANGVAKCTTLGAAAGMVTGAVVGGIAGYGFDPKSAAVPALIGAGSFGVAAGAICGVTRMFSQEAGERLTNNVVAGAKTTLLMGIPLVTVILTRGIIRVGFSGNSDSRDQFLSGQEANSYPDEPSDDLLIRGPRAFRSLNDLRF